MIVHLVIYHSFIHAVILYIDTTAVHTQCHQVCRVFHVKYKQHFVKYIDLYNLCVCFKGFLLCFKVHLNISVCLIYSINFPDYLNEFDFHN